MCAQVRFVFVEEATKHKGNLSTTQEIQQWGRIYCFNWNWKTK